MSFDGTTIHCLVHELDETLTGSHISRIAQPEREELQMTMKTSNGQRRLLISANASLPLIYLTDNTKASPMTAPSFCMLLRKHIQGGLIESIEQVGYERVIRFTIGHRNEMGDPARKYLYVEIMGKYSNIIFTDEDHVIIDAVKRVPASMSSVREVLPGRKYFIPSQEGHTNPLEMTDQKLFEQTVLSKPLSCIKALMNSFTGFSSLMSSEICYRAGIDGNMACASLNDAQKDKFWETFSSVMTDIRNNEYAPCIVCHPRDDRPKEYAALKLTSFADMKVIFYDSMSEVLETYYAARNLSTNIHQKSQNLRHIVTTLLERNRKKLAIQQKQLKDTGKMDKYRIWGELLHTYGYQAAPGDKQVICQNYYDDNKEITIPLDPNLSAMENAEKYFDRYNKLKRTAAAASVQIQETSEAIDHLESMLTALEMAENQADLDAVHDELAEYGYIHKRTKAKGRSAKSHPLHYRTEDGYDIYVGKNNHQNDELTFKFARGNDWWFHAKKLHGSHVIVRTDSGELPDLVFEIAAGLAAYYSQGRDTDRVEVDYLQKKNVKKPNSSVPGFVVYYTNYSMVAHPSLEGVTLVK